MENLRGKRVGVLIADLTDTYENELVMAFRHEAQHGDFDVLMLLCGRGQASAQPLLAPFAEKLVLDGAVDALVVHGGLLAHLYKLADVEAYLSRFKPLPVVLLGHESGQFPTVQPDNFGGMKSLTEHYILDHKITHFAFIKGPHDNPEADDRLQGFKAALANHGLDLDGQRFFDGSFDHSDGRRAAVALLADKAQGLALPGALISADDWMLLFAKEALEAGGIRAPHQILLGGFDNIPQSRTTRPAMTSVCNDPRDLAAASLRLCGEILAGRPVVPCTIVPTRLVLRKSCGCGTHGTIGNHVDTSLGRVKNYLEALRSLLAGCEAGITLPEAREFFFDNLENLFVTSMAEGVKAEEWQVVLRLMLPGEPLSWQHNLYLESAILLADLERALDSDQRSSQIHHTFCLQELSYFVGAAKTVAEVEGYLEHYLPSMGVRTLYVGIVSADFDACEVQAVYQADKSFGIRSGDTVPLTRFLTLGSERHRRINWILMPMDIYQDTKGFCLIEMGTMAAMTFYHILHHMLAAVRSIRFVGELKYRTDMLQEEIRVQTAELRRANEQLQDLTLKDPLTGLKNRRYLHEVVFPEAAYIARRRKYHAMAKNKRKGEEQTHLGFLLIDVDDFHRINNSWGYTTGDETLKTLGQLLEGLVRGSDTVIRWSGDAFLVVIRIHEPQGMEKVVRKLLKSMPELHLYVPGFDEPVTIRVSLGGCCYPLASWETEAPVDSMIKFCEGALLEAKDLGKHRAIIYGESASERQEIPGPA